MHFHRKNKMFIAQKTVTRHLDNKSSLIIIKGKSYSQEALAEMPAYYLSSGWLVAA